MTNNILLYSYIDDFILFFLIFNQSLPAAYTHNLELSTTNLTHFAVNFMDVNITILLNKI